MLLRLDRTPSSAYHNHAVKRLSSHDIGDRPSDRRCLCLCNGQCVYVTCTARHFYKVPSACDGQGTGLWRKRCLAHLSTMAKKGKRATAVAPARDAESDEEEQQPPKRKPHKKKQQPPDEERLALTHDEAEATPNSTKRRASAEAARKKPPTRRGASTRRPSSRRQHTLPSWFSWEAAAAASLVLVGLVYYAAQVTTLLCAACPAACVLLLFIAMASPTCECQHGETTTAHHS